MKNYRIMLLLLLSLMIATSCTKTFLDKKPNKALLVPTTLADFQALLDLGEDLINISPGLNIIAADDFYRVNGTTTSLTTLSLNAYTWAADIYQGATLTDWTTPFQQIFYCNVVLDGLEKLDPANSPEDWKRIKGSALFYRAYAYYNLAQEFAVPYDAATANSDLGIPIRLTSDVNLIAGRGTLQQTYDQIIKDITEATTLLPVTVPLKTRPCKHAAYALLARVYQTMENYDLAKQNASASLQLYSKLIDYNVLNPSAARPLPSAIPNGNDEVIYVTDITSYSSYNSSASTLVDTNLYRSYQANDLRKVIYFTDKGGNTAVFKGTYTGNSAFFGGIATDELYLIRAESYARSGDVTNAMNDLNTLLVNRWKKTTFIPLTAINADDALKQILMERRKELVSRGLRWSDLRRLNKDPRFAITITRMVSGQTFTLLAKSNRYTFPIPDNEINASGIQQNLR